VFVFADILIVRLAKAASRNNLFFIIRD